MIARWRVWDISKQRCVDNTVQLGLMYPTSSRCDISRRLSVVSDVRHWNIFSRTSSEALSSATEKLPWRKTYQTSALNTPPKVSEGVSISRLDFLSACGRANRPKLGLLGLKVYRSSSVCWVREGHEGLSTVCNERSNVNYKAEKCEH